MIDFADVKNPKEVARWQIDNPFAGTITTKEGGDTLPVVTFTTYRLKMVWRISLTGAMA